MNWDIVAAKQHFSVMVSNAASEPQWICEPGKEVAVLVDVETFRAFQAWREREVRRTLADDFAELRQICAEENVELSLHPRRDRANVFVESLDELAG